MNTNSDLYGISLKLITKLPAWLKTKLKASFSNNCSDSGSITAESATVMPVIVLSVCAVLFAGNIGFNYLQIQNASYKCAEFLTQNSEGDCSSIVSTLAGKNAKYSVTENGFAKEVVVSKHVSIFPALPSVKLSSNSIVNIN